MIIQITKRNVDIYIMDYLLILDYSIQNKSYQGQLEWLTYQLLQPGESDGGTVAGKQFNNLADDESFRQAMLEIVALINSLSMKFVNVRLVAQNTQLFVHILPQQFNLHKVSMPFIFTNFIDWKTTFTQKYGTGNPTLVDIARRLGIPQENDEKGLFKAVLNGMRKEGMIEDSAVVFLRDQKVQGVGQDFVYFRVVGLPFQISKNDIIQKLIEPDRFNIKSYGLSLIFQHGKFSGKAVIKIPSSFTEMIIAKDRMFIGKRYVEIILIQPEEYYSYKNWEEKQREEVKLHREPQRQQPSRKKDSSSESVSYSRSRSNEKKVEIHNLLSEAAVKVRGLPFALNNWDIEQLFKRFNFVRGSVKMGFLGDRKTGEAVILFPNREQAERGLVLHNLIVQGRYLQLKLITKDNYDRFR